MPPQDSAALWKSMTPDQRQQALTRMTPEQKTNLAAILGYQNGTPTTPTSAAPSNVGVLRPLTDRERFLDPNLYPVGAKGEGVGENLKNLAQRGGVGIFQLADAILNPGRTIRMMASSILPDPLINLLNKSPDAKGRELTPGQPNLLQQAYQALNTSRGPMEMMGKVAPIAGQALATAGFGEAAPAIASDTTAFARAAAPKLADAALFVPRTVTAGIRIGMQDLGGAGKEPVARAAREHAVKIEQAQKDYNDALRAVQEENATRRTEAANGLAEKRQTVEQTNAQTRADYLRKEMEARKSEAAQAAAEAQKQVIERGQRSYATRAIDNAKQTFRTVKAELDQRWDKLRDTIGERPINSGNVAKAIEEAKAKYLMGDPESLKLFDQLTEQLQQPKEFIDPGVPGQLKPTMKAMPWQQGRVFYTSLGHKMYGEGLAGNVFKATEYVHDVLGKELGATARNVSPAIGKLYESTKADWSQFKKDWDDMSNMSYSKSAMGEAGSPLARLVRAADSQAAARALANDRIMDQLARYQTQGLNPRLAAGFRALDKRMDGIDKVALSKHPSKPNYKPLSEEAEPRLMKEPSPPDLGKPKSPAQIRYEKLENYAGRPWRWYDLVPFNLFERTLLKSNDIRRWVAEQPRREIPVKDQITGLGGTQ